MVKRTRLLIADDHAVLRAGLRMLLNAQQDMEKLGLRSRTEVVRYALDQGLLNRE